MSSSLWAIQAARKSRKSDAVPGSSHYIAAEMKNNLQISKEGIHAVNQQVLQCASGLNSIIEKINTSASFGSLLDEIQSLKVVPDLNAYDDQSSRNHSTLRSDYLSSDASEVPLKSELNIMLSERIKNVPSSSSGHGPLLDLPMNGTVESPFGETTERSEVQMAPKKENLEPIKHLEQNKKHLDQTVIQKESSHIVHPAEVLVESKSQRQEPEVLNGEKPVPASVRSNNSDDAIPQADSPKRSESGFLDEDATEKPTAHPQVRLPFQPVESPVANNLPSIPNDYPTSTVLSPVMISRVQPDPITSPNVDLSFIPIANSVNANKNDPLYEYNAGVMDSSHHRNSHAKTHNSDEDHDAEPENDNSFHAISSAIRKSFAGKLSVNSYASTSVSDPSPMETNPISADSTGPFQTKVKLESTSSATDDSHPKKSKSFYQPSKRSSLFVSLPPREPITFRKSSRHSVKVKQEDLGSMTPNPVKKEIPDHIPQTTQTEQHKSSGRENVQSEPQGASTYSSEYISNRIGNQLSRSAIPKSNLPSLFSEKSYFNKTKPAQTSPKHSSVYGLNGDRVENKSRIKTTRSTRMTTETGSPMGLGVAAQQSHSRAAGENSPIRGKSPVRSRSPVRAKSSIGVKPKVTHSSSVATSRSPTKYGHQTDRSSSKYSQSNYSNTENEKDASENLISRLTIPTSSSAAKAVKTSTSKEMVLKNRFLTTTLNPENPPLFSSAPRAVSPRQETRKKPSEGPNSNYKKSLAVSSIPSLAPSDTKRTSKRSVIISLRGDLKHKSGQDSELPVKSPTKKPKPAPTTSNRQQEKVKKSIPNLMDTNVAPRKRPLGNAVPLPDAARGKFKKEKPKPDSRKSIKETHTPIRPTGRNGNNYNKPSDSPGFGPNTLPDIPSDDEVFKNTKYLKSWAETPAILRHMKERSNIDPVNVFGQVPPLRMNEVFNNVTATNEARESGKDS